MEGRPGTCRRQGGKGRVAAGMHAACEGLGIPSRTHTGAWGAKLGDRRVAQAPPAAAGVPGQRARRRAGRQRRQAEGSGRVAVNGAGRARIWPRTGATVIGWVVMAMGGARERSEARGGRRGGLPRRDPAPARSGARQAGTRTGPGPSGGPG